MGRHKKPMKGVTFFWKIARYKRERDMVLAFNGRVILLHDVSFRRVIWPLRLPIGLAKKPDPIVPGFIVLETTSGLIIAGGPDPDVAIRLASSLLLRTDPIRMRDILRSVPKQAVEAKTDEFWMAYSKFLGAIEI